MRIYTLLLCMIVVLSAGCVTNEQVKQLNPMGFSEEISPEAQKHFALARILWKQSEGVCSDLDLALEHLDKAIELEEKYAEAYFWRARALDQAGYGDDAFDDLSTSIRLNPLPKSYALRALVSLHMGNYLGAQRDIDYALHLDKKLALGLEVRGLVRQAMGEAQAACADLSAACAAGLCGEWEKAQQEGLCR